MADSNDSKNTTGDEAFKDPATNPDGRGEVGEKVTSSFDERTGVTQPFLQADGTQDNGAEDLGEPEGASRESTREGNKTTVEETEVAVKNGDVEGSKRSAKSDEKAKNPVK